MINIEHLIDDYELSKKNNVATTFFLNQKVQLLAGDASTRKYFRIFSHDQNSPDKILVYYPEILKTGKMSKSFELFLFWQKYYSQNNILVPAILAVDLKLGTMVLEDLGSVHLGLALAETAIDEENKILHTVVKTLLQIIQLPWPDHYPLKEIPRFSTEKLSFEVNHTLEYFIKGFLRVDDLGLKKELQYLWDGVIFKLQKNAFCLAHRDFHTRNMLIKNNSLYVIDFQDSMQGLPQYDLCSILDDCYYSWHPQSYFNATKFYWENLPSNIKANYSDYLEFMQVYQYMKLQRIFKAIGSFSYVWESRKDPHYLQYIGYAMQNLEHTFQLCKQDQELYKLRNLLRKVYYGH